MKIAFIGKLEDWQKQIFDQHLEEFSLKYFNRLSDLPSQSDFEIISVFTTHKLTREVLAKHPALKLIAVRSTGYDNVDLEYAKDNHITVVNVPGYGSHTVAEFTFGLILDLTRKINQAVRRVKHDKKFNQEDLRGVDLFGKTIGVIGTGHIGTNVIKIAHSFGMKVIAFDIIKDESLAREFNFSYLTLHELLKQSDIVTIHCPATPQTKHLINKDNISLMRSSAYLINTARGIVIETECLFHALKDHHIAGAGLDVLEFENDLDNQSKKLIGLENVIVTPHVAFKTIEAETTIFETTLSNIQNFIKGQPDNIVT